MRYRAALVRAIAPEIGGRMNPTLEKFGYPHTLVHEREHWAILVRPAQVTLGSLVLAARSDVTAYGALPAEAFAEQGEAVTLIERMLSEFTAYERINYLMLMMVDPNPHFHVIPRYAGSRSWGGHDFADAGWPGVPQLASATALVAHESVALRDQLAAMAARLDRS